MHTLPSFTSPVVRESLSELVESRRLVRRAEVVLAHGSPPFRIRRSLSDMGDDMDDDEKFITRALTSAGAAGGPADSSAPPQPSDLPSVMVGDKR